MTSGTGDYKPAGLIQLVHYDRQFLDKSFVWLSDPEIKALTMTPDFSREQQEDFFKSLPSRDGYFIWGLSSKEGSAIGAAGLKNIRGRCAEYWGYIGEKHLWGRGLGSEIIREVETQAISKGFTQLDLVVSAQNTRARRLYVKCGFEEFEYINDSTVRMLKWMIK